MNPFGKKYTKKDIETRTSLIDGLRRLEKDQEVLEERIAKFERYRESELAKLTKERESLEKEKDNNAMLKQKSERELELIGDFTHEQKRINERIEKAINTTRDIVRRHQSDRVLDLDTTNLVLNNWKTIEGLSDISNKRMELFEFSVAPGLFKKLAEESLSPYKCFEKIYKSINSGFDKEARIFNLDGPSYGSYRTKRILPIAFFILLDNAWKYTIPAREILITFKESERNLTVMITNWGPWLEDEEIEQLTERGYRGKNALITHRDNGKGLGLMIAKNILDACGVKYQFMKMPCTPITFKNIKYGLFGVELKFSPIQLSKSRSL